MTMDISYYDLEGRDFPIGSQGGSKGSLIRVNFEGSFGFANLHPVTGWNDLPIEKMVLEIKRGEKTLLFDRALHFARLDAIARKKKEPIFKERKSSFKNHYLILRQYIEEGKVDRDFLQEIKRQEFTIVKVKPSSDISVTLAIVEKIAQEGIRVRLDFEAKLTEAQLIEFLKRADSFLHAVDYIEDPFPFDEEKWRNIQAKFPVSLALDRNSEQAVGLVGSAKVLIVKPGRQNELDFFFSLAHGQRVVITSSLDHPLGQLGAAFAASKFKEETHGIFSHRIYKETPFSLLLEGNAPYLSYPEGTGFGYDALLATLPWSPL